MKNACACVCQSPKKRNSVCPSGALFYGTRERMAGMRPNSSPVNEFRFGLQRVKTRVNVMMPKGSTELVVDGTEEP